MGRQPQPARRAHDWPGSFSLCTYEVGEHCYNYDTEMWECELCYRQFYEKRDLEQHLNSGAHEADLYRCQGCQRTFRNLGALNQHVTATDCSQRAARQVRTLLSDAQRQPALLQLTDRSDVSASHTAPAESAHSTSMVARHQAQDWVALATGCSMIATLRLPGAPSAFIPTMA